MRVLLLTLVAFSAETASAASVPCKAEDLPPAVKDLARDLDNARTQAVRLEIATRAETLSRTETLSARDRACAAYLAGSAHFFDTKKGKLHQRAAADALRLFIRAAVLAPAEMSALQARTRLKTAWRRLGKVSGWIDRASPRPIAVPAADEDDTLILSPGDPDTWTKTCGAAAACLAAVQFELPRRAGQAFEAPMAPGRYTLSRRTACGTAVHPVPVDIGAGSFPIPPAAACPVTLEVVDREGPVSDWHLATPGVADVTQTQLKADMGPVTVSALGYRTQKVELPAAGGPLKIEMERCPVKLQVRTIPPDARLEGIEAGPWGRRTLSARRPGHRDLQHVVEVPPPKKCADATHQISLVMERNILIAAYAGNGKAVTPSRFTVNGAAVDVLGFHRPPGQYGFRVEHAEEGTVTGRFEVAACTGGACPPVSLRIDFAPRRRPPAAASKWTMALGAGMALGGLAFGLAALESNQSLETYSNKRAMGISIEDLEDRRDQEARTADQLFLLGGALLGSGYLWYRTSQEPSP